MKSKNTIFLILFLVLILDCNFLGSNNKSGNTKDVIDPDFPSIFGDWENAGVQGGIPYYTIGVNVLDYGAVVNDGNDDTAAIQNAINACEEGNAVFFPAGEYNITGTLEILKPIVLRGAGPILAPGNEEYYTIISNNYNGRTIYVTSDWAGIEDIHIHTDYSFDGTGGEKILFDRVENSWIKNIQTSGYVYRAVYLNETIHCEVRDSYIHNSLDEANTLLNFQAYGIQIYNGNSSYNLIENNVLDWFRHALLIQEFDGSDPYNNVFSYNFSWNVFSEGEFSNRTDMEFHNNSTCYNLVEGNVFEQVGFQSDGHYDNTIFRNRVNNGGIKVAVRKEYVIGNEFTEIKNPGSTQAIANGNSPTGSNLGNSFVDGNYVTVANAYHPEGIVWHDSNSDHTIPDSKYMSSRPEWFGDLDWPCYGGDLMPGNTRRNPAEVRYWTMFFPEVSPSNLQAVGSVDNVVLTWDNNSTNTVDFIICRSTDGVNFERIGETFNTTYTDTITEPGQYHYYVRARNHLGGKNGDDLGGESNPTGSVTVIF